MEFPFSAFPRTCSGDGIFMAQRGSFFLIFGSESIFARVLASLKINGESNFLRFVHVKGATQISLAAVTLYCGKSPNA